MRASFHVDLIPLNLTILIIPGVWIIRFQIEYLWSKSLHYTDIRFASLHKKTLKAFFKLLPTLSVFTVETPGGKTNIQIFFSI